MQKELKLGKYKHFKGDVMEVIGVALDSETQEEFVVYKHITGEKKGESNYWIRRAPMFLEEIKRDGKKVKRFTFIE
jgi:hypothetical protein